MVAFLSFYKIDLSFLSDDFYLQVIVDGDDLAADSGVAEGAPGVLKTL